jgi:DNA sulfur modification protein DndE
MGFKIRTSHQTAELFGLLGKSQQLQPFTLAKLAISLSVKSPNPLSETDFNTDNKGLELNRQTITGEFDALIKCLIEQNEGRYIEESEYFQTYVKAHLDRGAVLLFNEHRYGGDLFVQLLQTDQNI